MSVVPPPHRSPAWSATAIAELLDVVRCPVCAAGIVSERRCPACGADFSGPVGHDLWQASRRAADALRARQAVLDRVPVLPAVPRPFATAGPVAAGGTPVAVGAGAPVAVGAGTPVAGIAGTGPVPGGFAGGEASRTVPSPGRAPAPRSSATVQSVLAVAGAGLVAVAAVVFTFFNPDLSDPLVRAGIVGGIAAAFLGGGALLARRRLRFSAEAIGSLGVVFLALTVATVVPVLPLNPWVFAGLAALAAGAGLAVLGPRAGIRAWRWSGLLTLAFVPLMLAAGADSALATTMGCLASAAAASALIAAAGHGARGASGAERVTLTVVQFGFAMAAFLAVWGTAPAGLSVAYLASATLAAIAAIAVASARHPAGAVWTGVAGAAIVAAVAVLPVETLGALPVDAWLAVFLAAAGLGLVVVGALSPLHRRLSRRALFTGAVAVAAAVSAQPTLAALLTLAGTVAGGSRSTLFSDLAGGLAVGLATLALSLAAFAALTRAPGAAGSKTGTRRFAMVGAWYAVLAFLMVMCVPGLELWARITLGLVSAVGASAVLTTAMRDASTAARLPLVVGAHAAVGLAAVLSWRDADLTVAAGAAVVASIAVLALTVPRAARFVHVGVGFAYALAVLATAIARTGADAIVMVCLTTCAAGVAAIAVTFARRVPSREWYAVLAVTAVPFAIGVVQVVFERSGWTALSTAVIFCLALTLVTTTRPGLGIVVRTLAAATLVPAIAVVVVCLGAQLLPMSGSPVVLPVVAAIVAGVLASADVWGAALARRMPAQSARAARLAVEASTLLTAAIAVGLSLVRTSAGLPTTLLVLVILGIGFAATARFSPRRYAWPLAGAAFTGALWSAWGIAGVTGLEPYLLPPALGAAAVAVLLTARGRPAAGLYSVGLAVAVVPVLLALASGGTAVSISAFAVDAGSAARAYALVAAAWVLVAASLVITRSRAPRVRRLRALRAPTLAIAIVAATGAAVQGVRWGTGLDMPPTSPAIVAAVAFGVVGAGAAAIAGRALHREALEGTPLARTRWLGAPAVLIVAVAAWPAIERDWFVIWTMWALLLGLLTLMLAVAARGLRAPTGLPPVWFLFAVSFVTAVVAWSPRDLRVEWFSLPLGLFLLAAGALALRRPADFAPARTWTDWPAGWTGSWPLLGPGLVTMLSASVAATYTDPRTWRAILVMAIALVAILVGATQRLAAPFLIGIIVLPVENVLAFVVQIGRGIQAMPWWITLSVVGAVLLIIAVGYERRTGDGTGIAARLRDLA